MKPMHVALRALPALLSLLPCTPLVAQCGRAALPGDLPGVGPVGSTIRGAADFGSNILIGGDFTIAGSLQVNHLAVWNRTTLAWSDPGANLNGPVSHVVKMANGDVVIAGAFTSVAGLAATGMARWDGSSWYTIPAAFTPTFPTAFAAAPNGELIAAGDFTFVNGLARTRVASWDGSNWNQLGTGANGPVFDVDVLSSGLVVIGGTFTLAGGVVLNGLARWNGSAWSGFGTGPFVPTIPPPAIPVSAVKAMANGDLVIGGDFTSIDGTSAIHLARWDGGTWSAFGGGPGVLPRAINEFANGNVLVQSNGTVKQWNGASWSTQLTGGAVGGGAFDNLSSVTNGVVVGAFQYATLGSANSFGGAFSDGSAWFRLGTGFDDDVNVLVPMPNGDLVASGYFGAAGSVATDRIARWNGTAWSAIGTGGVVTQNGIGARPNGDLLATAVVTTGDALKRWNGTAWVSFAPLPTAIGFPTIPVILGRFGSLPNGDIVAFVDGSISPSTSPSVRSWNGTTWTVLGAINGAVFQLKVLANGDVFVGGPFTSIGGVTANGVARWNGSTWTALGSLTASGTITGVDELPNGDIVVGVNTSSTDRVERWDGSSWSVLGTAGGLIASPGQVLALPNGNVAVTVGSLTQRDVALWDGSSWTSLVTTPNSTDYYTALALLPNGDLAIGGHFATLGAQVSAYFGVLRPSCPATGVAFGSGCTGSAGPVALAVTDQAWTGATYRSQTTGTVANGFALTILSTSAIPTPVSLSVFFPNIAVGCLALITADTVLGPFTVSGAPLVTTIPVPANPALAGTFFREQTVIYDFGQSVADEQATSSNAVTATIGVL